jgi:uncharacterized protein
MSRIQEFQMKVSIALISICFLAGPRVYAQTPASEPAQPAARTQPGTPAPSQKPSASPPAAPSELLPALRPLPEQADLAKDAAIRHLMEVTGTAGMGDQILNSMTAQIRNTLSRSLPPDRLQKIMDAFTQNFHQRVSSEQVADSIVPIYASHFSLEDIEGITRFYESPLGRRLVRTLPEVSQESQSSASQLVRGNAIQVLQGMTDEYPELKPLLQSNNGAKPQPAPGAEQPAPRPHLSQPPQPPHP